MEGDSYSLTWGFARGAEPFRVGNNGSVVPAAVQESSARLLCPNTLWIKPKPFLPDNVVTEGHMSNSLAVKLGGWGRVI